MLCTSILSLYERLLWIGASAMSSNKFAWSSDGLLKYHTQIVWVELTQVIVLLGRWIWIV